MQFQECLAEACGEGRCRLGDTTFCTGQFCGEAGQEVVLCLLRSQDRYRRKYAECVSGEEDNFLSCRSCGYRTNDVLNMIDRIRYTSILCNALIVEINLSVFIYCNILKKSVTFDSIVDIWLRLFVQVDNLCIAAAFEVEYAVVIPAVLVITDQKTFRVCGKSCLTCSGKSEEDSCVLAVHICIG